MSAHTPEAIRKETKVYITVFVALAALTLITVAVSYLHLTGWRAIGLALFIAGIKGFLVAGFFMHLLSERKLIYAVLAVTALFFGMLLWIPHAEDDVYEGHRTSAAVETRE